MGGQRTDTDSPRSTHHMVWLARLVLLLPVASCLLFVAGGCKPNKRYDLIEAELRTREQELAQTRAALEQARNLNRAFVQQSQLANGQPPDPSTPVYLPVKQITLARGTGGVNEDDIPGDEGLMVVVTPKDEDGSAVKVPARVQIAAWEVTPAGLKRPIGSWDVPPEKVRPKWRSGFISTGYFIPVPWQTYPASENVRIAVRLTTLDGRAFETDKDILVSLCQTPRVGSPTANVSPTTPFPSPIPSPVPTPTPVPQPQPQPKPPSGGRELLFPDPLPPGVEELPQPTPTGNGQ